VSSGLEDKTVTKTILMFAPPGRRLAACGLSVDGIGSNPRICRAFDDFPDRGLQKNQKIFENALASFPRSA
jgi:hypothetical protein